jgi:hypothetical protein
LDIAYVKGQTKPMSAAPEGTVRVIPPSITLGLLRVVLPEPVYWVLISTFHVPAAKAGYNPDHLGRGVFRQMPAYLHLLGRVGPGYNTSPHQESFRPPLSWVLLC